MIMKIILIFLGFYSKIDYIRLILCEQDRKRRSSQYFQPELNFQVNIIDSSN